MLILQICVVLANDGKTKKTTRKENKLQIQAGDGQRDIYGHFMHFTSPYSFCLSIINKYPLVSQEVSVFRANIS